MTFRGAPFIEVTSPAADAGRRILRAYYEDIVGRYYSRHHGRPATGDEIDEAMRQEPSDDLAPPTGVLLVAYGADGPLGCAGLRLAGQGPGPRLAGEGAGGESGRIGEVTRVFVVPAARGRGVGAWLLRSLEDHARQLGVTLLRLDTRDDLLEARRLYARHGYREIPPLYERQYADHWFEKTLEPHARKARVAGGSPARSTRGGM